MVTQDSSDVERWVTAEEVAAHLSMTPYWVREMAKRGELPGTKIGVYWRFRLSEVDEAMAARQQTPRTRR
jgi:excisionase family DNA binding protein